MVHFDKLSAGFTSGWQHFI